MILKVFRHITTPDAPYIVHDETMKVYFETNSVPYRVGRSCQFRPAFWTAFFKTAENIEFMRQVDNPGW